MSNQTRGMLLSLSDKVWGNLRTPAARTAWAKAQPARCKAEDEQFRTELIEAGFPAAIVRTAWITGKSRELKKPIERPNWFEGFIHQGKWIAGGDSVETLIKLAEYQLEK